jgi:hypothetical protein
MQLRKNLLATGVSLVALMGLCMIAAPSAAASAVTRCPSGGTPPPGSTIRGGLEVDGFQCNLTDVTVYGGITVEPTGAGDFPIGYLSIDGSTVYGGIVVNGGALDVGVDGFYSFNRTFNPTTINGGIALNQALFFSTADASIHGGLKMNGARDPVPVFGGGGFPSQMCASDVWGDVSLRDLSPVQGMFERAFIGDPGEAFYGNGANCDANTIHGSVFLANTNQRNPFTGEGSEIEGNTVTGSVHVDHSTAEVWANTIGGSLLCTNGTVIQPPAPGDPSSENNIVNGANTCT